MSDLLDFALSACIGLGYALMVFTVVACAVTLWAADHA